MAAGKPVYPDLASSLTSQPFRQRDDIAASQPRHQANATLDISSSHRDGMGVFIRHVAVPDA
jgi:hypothetical protein